MKLHEPPRILQFDLARGGDSPHPFNLVAQLERVVAAGGEEELHDGVVAVAAYGEQYAPWRNAFYNILDLLSKNLAGVVVSVVALGATCPAAL